MTTGPSTAAADTPTAIHFLGGAAEPLRAICRILRLQGHRTRTFADAAAYAPVLADGPAADRPDMVVVDQEAFEDRSSLADLGLGPSGGVPFVVASDRDELPARLAAFRAGASGYVLKPLGAGVLSSLAETFVGRQSPPPFRVLLVDDMASMLAFHAAILREGGMVVQTLTEPLRLLETLDEFRPDVLVLDVFMPEAEGPELAAVLRDRTQDRSLPILFLSSETDPERQIRALELGGDDFLVKPVEPVHFVAAVSARARRARHMNDVSARLRSVQYERDREHQALERHALVSVTDRAGTIIHVNDKFCEVSGFSRSELVGQNHRIVKSGHHPAEFYRDLWRTIRSGEIWTGEMRNRRKDGTPYWVESTIVPFFDDRGAPYQYVSIRTEITRVKQAEERLRISQSYANIGTWDWSIGTGIVLCSERVGPLFGLPESIAETTYEAFLDTVHPDDREHVVRAVGDCLEHGAPYRVEHRCLWPDGSVRWLVETGDVVRDEDGRPTNMLGVVQDITELKRAEEALVAAKEEAEAANRAKSDFLSAMSHELRTPLNAVIGFAQVLELDEELNDDQRDSAQTIRRSGKHLLGLINEVLDLARIESGRLDLSLEDVGLEDVFSGCGKLIAPLAGEAGITVQFSRAADAHAVVADVTRLRQVLLNFLSNAVKYNRQGGRIAVTAARVDGGRIRISVDDTGDGIPERKLGQLFTAFNRLGAEHTAVEGTGIGLVISKRLIEAMNGSIGVDSAVGAGSSFWVELPAAALPSPRDQADPATGLAAPLPAGTVLYVEDNAANLKLVRQALSRHPQVSLLTAETGAQGLELARAAGPDLVLLDINMAGMGGLELLARLRADPATRSIPAVAISAAAMEKDVDRALRAGFRHYLTKPIDIVELLQVISRLLREPDRRRAGDRRTPPFHPTADANRHGDAA